MTQPDGHIDHYQLTIRGSIAMPLWQQPIPVIGLTGEYQSGKTLFGLSISPGPKTLVYDMEKSSLTYESIGFTRVDVGDEMLKLYPKGYAPIRLFEWWLADVRRIQPGTFDVIMLDPASEIETGLVDWVQSHPEHFNHTEKQYDKMSGIMWGNVKDYWKLILNDLASRCETFVYTVHMGDEYKGNDRTGKRKAKGKSTLMELASLFLEMERKADPKGMLPEKPSAKVSKSRLGTFQMQPDGELKITPILPPRLPVATPHAIREYMRNPPDPTKLKKEERIQEDRMSDDERLMLETAKAQAQAEAARIDAEKHARQQLAAEKRAERESAAAEIKAAAGATGQPVKTQTTATPAPTTTQTTAEPNGPTDAQLEAMAELREHYFISIGAHTDDAQATAWSVLLTPYGVTSARALTQSQADILIDRLRKEAGQFATA